MNVAQLRVLLRVPDFEASVRFYQDVLGLECLRRWENPKGCGIILRAGTGGSIELIGPRDEPPTRRVELWLQVDDVAGAYERVQAWGATIAR
ncbi:MAG: VOC family protein, partial [Chloroflexi bacterium]|nr:VOC family protein [Chloroflexota bacterium]